MTFVGIVEDDEEIRKGIVTFLSRNPDYVCELDVGSVEDLLARITPQNIPQVIIMDLGLPGMSGIDGMKLIKEKYPDIDIIVFTVYNDPKKIFDSLCAGATGYLLKNTPFEEIQQSIDIIANGGSPMTPQIARKVIEYFNPVKNVEKNSPLSQKEKEIVIGLVDGLSYKLIADRMQISIETVRFHIKNIYRKLQVNCKAEVITKSLRGEI